MDLAAISGAACTASAGALLFATLVYCSRWLARRISADNAFAGSIMTEPAQRYRDAWRGLGQQQALYLTSAVVFVLVFAATWPLQPGRWFAAAPAWQPISALAIIAAAVLVAGWRFVRLVILRRHIRLRRDAGLLIGHALQRISANHNRTFHDVPCSAGTVDHVIAGSHGVYAVHVIARKPPRNNRLRLQDDNLYFLADKRGLSLANCRKRAERLARECGKHLKQTVHVRSVVAVPGWEIDMQSNDDFLVTNERNLSMLTGWKDQRDYLMNEDVEALHELLTERCTRLTMAV